MHCLYLISWLDYTQIDKYIYIITEEAVISDLLAQGFCFDTSDHETSLDKKGMLAIIN